MKDAHSKIPLLLNGGLLLGRHFGVDIGTKRGRLILFGANIWICNDGVVAGAQMTYRDFARNHAVCRVHIVAQREVCIPLLLNPLLVRQKIRFVVNFERNVLASIAARPLVCDFSNVFSLVFHMSRANW